SPANFQNAVVDTPGRALTTNVNGTARNTNNTLTDGAANINVWLPHHTAYVQPVESIETVNITTNSFDAEQGMAGGAAITVSTKSGTNEIHGSGFWFHNDQHLNTAPYFRAATYKLPLTIFNQGGGTIGGPIKKDKLFYFFSFERTMERTGYSGNYSVAPQDFRDGDLSQRTNIGIIYDPATAPMNAAASRTPFANNIIPKSRWNPLFPNIYSKMPLPNQISPTDPFNLSGNYFAAATLKLDRNQYDLKMNYAATEKLMIWGKYSRMDAPVTGAYPFGELGGGALGTDGQGDTRTQMPVIGYNYTFSPTFFMDGVFGFTRMDQTVLLPGTDKNIGLDEWKIPGTNGGRQYADDPRYGGAPHLSSFGFSDIGFSATWAPVWRKEQTYTYTTNFSKIQGAHEFRWGFEARKLMMDHWQPETANPRGRINFAGGPTQHPTQNTTLRGGTSWAAALLGLTASYTKSIQYFEMKTREWQFAGYFRDRWQVNRKLTLNLGVRYEYYPLINRADRGIERWDPSTNIVYFGGIGNTPRNVGMTVSKKLFAPRVGFAYRLSDNNVIRAGYGITFDAVPFGRPLRGLYPATLTGSWPTPVAFGWFNNLNEGIPDVPTPDISSGQGILPVSLNMGPRSPWGGQLNRGYIQSWNLTFERKLPFDMVGSVAYVATKTIRQMIDRNINTIGPGLGGDNRNLPLYKAHGRTIGMNMWDGIGYATYNSLQATLNKNFTHGLFMKSSFTWGKALNMADDTGWAGVWGWNWEPMLDRNYGPAGYDRKYSFTNAWVYELPFGKGQKWGTDNTAMDLIFGGWRINGTFYAYTGTPFYISGSGSSLLCTGCTQTAEQLGPFVKLDKKGVDQPFFEQSAFRDPLFWQRQTGEFKPGSTGKLPFYGPGFWQLNPAMFKNFKITERVNMEFRAESNNLAHNTRWSNPNGSSGNMQLNADGSLNTSVTRPLRGFGSITGADSFRQFRFGLRLQF
ncbi:MAG: hypothetical protein IH602_02385, partial [Bryobacteraceae bacterium]|nr:hypothetical protein [Bryobacteraceae bacterium]